MNLADMFERLETPDLVLFVLPAVLFVFVLVIRSKAHMRAGLGLFVVLSRAFLVAALILLLCGPLTTSSTSIPPSLDVLIDVSRSMASKSLEATLMEAEGFVLAQQEERKNLQLKCIAFAGKADVFLRGQPSRIEVKTAFQSLRQVESLRALNPLASNLTLALELADAGRDQKGDHNRVIFTDGALGAPPNLLSPQIPTFLVAPLALSMGSTRAKSLALPLRIEVGDPVPMELTYVSSETQKVKAELFIDGQRKKVMTLDLEAGSHQLSFSGKDIELSPGHHEFVLRLYPEDGEVLDDAVGAQVLVHPKRRVLYLIGNHRGNRAPAMQRALQAQGVDLLAMKVDEVDVSGAFWQGVRAVVLDRVVPSSVGETLTGRILENVQAGGGLILVPEGESNALLPWNRHPLGTSLPLAGLPEIKRKNKEPKKEDPPAEKLSDPDIKKSKEKEIDAPTLSLLLVIDNSASMKDGNRLLFAVRGAIATLRKLHPEDRIGVITYNERPVEVVPIQEAGNRDSIERAIGRIQARGATNIKAALLFAKETLGREDSAVKSIVLLSDGFTRPFNVKKVAQDLYGHGITVTTVGVGSSFDTPTLTQIAKYSGGTGPIPARNAKQLPAVMVDVAARLIDRNNLRSAPEKPKKKDDKIHRPEAGIGNKPKAKLKEENKSGGKRIEMRIQRPTSYLDKLPFNFAPSIYGLHRSQARPGAWVALASKSGQPILSHWGVGDGIVAMTTLPLEGAWAKDLVLWEAYSPLVAQLLRFCAWDPALDRFHLSGYISGNTAQLFLDDAFTRNKETPWQISGYPSDCRLVVGQDGNYQLIGKEEFVGPFLRLSVTPPGEKEARVLSLFVPPPEEVRSAGLNLSRLDEWAQALGGRFDSRRASKLPLTLSERTSKQDRKWIWQSFSWLLLIFAAELVIKRLLRRPQLES